MRKLYSADAWIFDELINGFENCFSKSASYCHYNPPGMQIRVRKYPDPVFNRKNLAIRIRAWKKILNLLTTHTWNFLTFPNFWLRIALWNFFFEKFCFHPLTALLRHAEQKYFFVFCFNQKNLFTKPSWNNF